METEKNITMNTFQEKVYVHLFGKAGKIISLELDKYAKLVYMQDHVTEVAGELLKEVCIRFKKLNICILKL